MNNLAIVILDGNLTHDPEIKTTRSEKKVTTFTVALNHEWGSKDGNPAVSYIPVEAWDRLGENCGKYLTKGNRVTVTGYLRQERWKDDNGTGKSRVKIVAQQVRFDSKKQFPDDNESEEHAA